MKKILILFIGVIFTWNFVVAQSPYLNWRVVNPRIEQVLSIGTTWKNYLCWDIQVSATAGGTYIDGMQAVFTMNTVGLGPSLAANRKYVKGPLALGDDGGGTQFYNVTLAYTGGKLFVGVLSDPAWAGLPGSSDYMNEVTTSYQTLVTVKIAIVDKTQIANLVFVPSSMDGVSQWRDGSGSPVYYSSPYSYDTHDLANAYLGRIYSTYANSWTQCHPTPASPGGTYLNWATTENTSVWDGNGHITVSDALVTGLYVDPGAICTVDPDMSMTASGNTYIADANGLVIASTGTGTGSFRDNGTITYGTSGSAKVETYITNAASPGSFYAHLVGPTVNDPVFETANGYPGVYLSQFDIVGLGTFAYAYNNATNLWTNIFSNTDLVRSTQGILLSTADGINHTMDMSGKLVTGNISSVALPGVDKLELLSNPYASALDFDLFYAANSGVISNKVQVYNASAGVYQSYQVGSGGALSKNIQVGQGFFVETSGTATASFTNAMRLHATSAFLKDEYANQLRINMTGNGYSDATFMYFRPDGVPGYDDLTDTYKWFSLLPEAAEIWTVANDESILSMNSLPLIENTSVSVPMGFKCSAEDTYTITAENIGSFESGTTIYLEDKATGAEWQDLVANPVYTFTGSPDADQDRFIVHFFGPTGINDPEAGLVTVYAWGQDAYIINRGKETIKEYVAYDLMGRELHRGTLPNNTVNKVTIGDVSAYYIVKVITKEGRIYTEKVYITK